MGVDRYRVCELYAAGPDGDGSGSGYRLGDRLVLTARHVIAPALAGPGSRLLVRPVGAPGWLPARVEWEDADADAALIVVEANTGGRRLGSRCCAGGSWPAVIRCRARRSGSRGPQPGRAGCGIPRTCTGIWPRSGS
jgi:hypothetical protein